MYNSNMPNKFEFPYTFKDLSEAEKQIVASFETGYEAQRLFPTKYCCPKGMEKYANELYNFEPRKDDIWLVGYPRCGTTLTQEILYLLGTNLDYEKAASTIMDERFPFIESVAARSDEEEEVYQKFLKKENLSCTSDEERAIPVHVKLMNSKEKRFIKSHSGFDLIYPDLLEVGCKVVFITRNIKDCFVSNFYYPIKGNDERNEQELLNNKFRCVSNNLDPFGNYFEVLKAAWKRRHNKNLLFLFYEEVVADKRAAVLKIADFLGKSLTKLELDRLLDHIEIKNFKKNKSVNNDHLVNTGLLVKTEKLSFIRQGKSGGWRELFSKEMNNKFDQWIRASLKEIPDFEMPESWKLAMDLE